MIRRIDGPDGASRERIVALLGAHAERAGHPFAASWITFEATEGDVVLGGLSARLAFGWMFVELLAVAPDARGQGWGRRLMQAAEDEARARGMTGIWLDTFSFQAPGFYAALGFAEFGRIDEYPPGQHRSFLMKRLDR